MADISPQMIKVDWFLVEGDVVRWNTDGTKFAIICGSTVTVYGIVSLEIYSSAQRSLTNSSN